MQRVLLAVVLVLLAVRTVIRNQDYAQPIKLWTQAVAANPDNPRAWSWLACESSRVNPAAAQRVTFEMALRWHDNSSVQFDVAETYLRLHGNAPAAARCYRRVIELDPSHVRAQLRLVWLLAAHAEDDLRDGDEALEIASRLQTQYPSSPETLDALAIAQAECGDFEAAIATTMAAITAGGAQGDLAASLRQRLECYRERHPFRFRQT